MDVLIVGNTSATMQEGRLLILFIQIIVLLIVVLWGISEEKVQRDI
jgi:hypothetical protein